MTPSHHSLLGPINDVSEGEDETWRYAIIGGYRREQHVARGESEHGSWDSGALGERLRDLPESCAQNNGQKSTQDIAARKATRGRGTT